MSNSTSIHFAEPWYAVEVAHSDSLVAELQRELSPGHSLFDQPVTPIARRHDCDDVLFRFGRAPERFAVVHLTWTGRREHSPQWPHTEVFVTLDEFVEKRMRQDSLEYGSSA